MYYTKNSLKYKSVKNNKLVASILFNKISLFILISIFLANFSNAAIISGSIYDLSLQKESDAIIEINTVPKQLLVSKDGDYAFNVKPGNYTLYSYTLYSYNITSEAIELLVISDDGNYTLDIILEEKSIYSTDDMIFNNDALNDDFNVSLNDINNSIDTSNNTLSLSLLLGLLILVMLIIVGIYMFLYSRLGKLTSINSKLDKNSLKSSFKKISESQYDLVKNKKSETENNKGSENDNTHHNTDSLDEYGLLVLNIIKKNTRITQKDLRNQIPLSEAKISLIISDLEDKGMIRKIKKGRGNILIFKDN